jgi:two-component system response regulator (stage 0 sporulation protein A)
MEGYAPIIYILSGLGADSIVRALNELGIDFYSMKPVLPSVVVRNLNTLTRQRDHHAFFSDTSEENAETGTFLKQDKLEETIKYVLLRFNLLPHRKSTKCVQDALALYMSSSGLNPLLTKFLYPQVAQRYRVSNISVEKNIRNAITQIQKNNTELFRDIFSYSTKRHITNGEFLSIMSDYISKSVKRNNNLAHGEPK